MRSRVGDSQDRVRRGAGKALCCQLRRRAVPGQMSAGNVSAQPGMTSDDNLLATVV